MLLTHLSLTNFRNFARLDIDVPGGPVLLVGGNAQGKTSLLEAVYFLATFVSFHATNDRQLINFMAGREPLAVTRIVADFQYSDALPGPGESSQREHRLEVRLIQEANGFGNSPGLRKEILFDGVKRKTSEAIGNFNAVLFLPHMLRVVEGSPEERRRYLNLAMGQVLPHYARHLGEYARVLTQRNALLKQISERGGDPEQLNYWDEQLTAIGAQVIHARIRAIAELERQATRLHSQLTRGEERLRLAYQPSYDPLPTSPLQYSLPLDAAADRSGFTIDYIQQGFLESLKSVRNEEIARGMTTLGPHRDELRFLSNGIDLGVYGSRGQGRTAVLAMKLAEVAWMKEKSGQWPVLLLDEVLAELDPARRQDLLSNLLESEQSLLTTTDLDLFQADFVQRAKIWHIQAGRLLF
ncbi:MAG: DNA replication/repair protein RecF [Anaerolineales bacterium]|nr:DNA replication/repair protein RecF [Anaerolineales bacterium]